MSQFLPLAEAAAHAYGSLVPEGERAVDRPRREAHLNYLAGELASILPVFAAHDGAEPQILPPERVIHGRFTQSGRLLSLDGRVEPVSGLCVRRADLEAAIEQLRRRLALPPG